MPEERQYMALKLIGKPRPAKAQVINVKTKKLFRKAQSAYELKPQRLLDVVYPYGVEGRVLIFVPIMCRLLMLA